MVKIKTREVDKETIKTKGRTLMPSQRIRKANTKAKREGNKENEKMLSLKKKKVFKACGLSYRKVQDFRKAYTTKYIGKVCFGNDDNTFLSFVENFRKEMKDSQ